MGREWGKEESNKCYLLRQYVPTNADFKKESKEVSGKETWNSVLLGIVYTFVLQPRFSAFVSLSLISFLIFNLSFVSFLNEAHVKYYWFLQKMLISCRSETNGNFISLLSRRGSLSSSLFSGATPPLLCIPHRSVGCPATERSGRCISTQVSNASHAPRQVFLAGCKQQKTAFCSF